MHSDQKLVRVPARLRSKIEDVIFRSPTILANCPFGHDVKVEILVQYVPKARSDLHIDIEVRRKKTGPGPKLVQSDEPFGDEHFELLLQSPLQKREKRFVLFFRENGNRPTSPLEWERAGFPLFTSIREINFLCRNHRLGVSFAGTGEYDTEDGFPLQKLLKYKFFVMEKPRSMARD